MAYSLNTTHVRQFALNSDWSTIDATSLTLQYLLDHYRNVYFELTHPALDQPVYCSLNTLRESMTYTQLQRTVTQWLTDNGNDTLPTSTLPPQLNVGWLKYADAFKAGFNVNLINIGRAEDSALPAVDKHDLILKKPGVNFNQMWQYLLVSVAGFIHRCTKAPDGIYVVDGGRTGRISNLNIAGVLSFKDVGKIEQFSIQSNMLHSFTETAPLYEGILVQLPKPMTGKTPLLVLGGFLHMLDNAYSIINDTTLAIYPSRINIVDRFLYSRNRINTASIPIERSEANPGKIAVEELRSDAFLRAYCTLPQSFIVLLDSEDVYLKRHVLENTKLPGVYQQSGPFKRLPLFGTYGALLDYTAYQEYERYVYNALPVHEQHYMHRTTQWQNVPVIDDTHYLARPWRIADGHLVEFGRYL